VVYYTTGKDIDMVIMDRKIIVKGGKLTTIDKEAVWKEGEKRGHEVVKRAGLTEKVKGRWLIQ
jgi:hypothetical protein